MLIDSSGADSLWISHLSLSLSHPLASASCVQVTLLCNQNQISTNSQTREHPLDDVILSLELGQVTVLSARFNFNYTSGRRREKEKLVSPELLHHPIAPSQWALRLKRVRGWILFFCPTPSQFVCQSNLLLWLGSFFNFLTLTCISKILRQCVCVPMWRWMSMWAKRRRKK